MAIWQYIFLIIPRNSISENELGLAIDEDDYFEDDIFWTKEPISVLFFKDISKIMPEGKSWSKNLLVFGDLESNCFEVYSENDLIESVSFRINFTINYEPILSQIIEFCILKGLVILDENLSILPLNLESIKCAINSAPQVRKYNLLLNNESPE